MTLLYDLPSHVPVLLVSTSDSPYETLSEELQDLFSTFHNEVCVVVVVVVVVFSHVEYPTKVRLIRFCSQPYFISLWS